MFSAFEDVMREKSSTLFLRKNELTEGKDEAVKEKRLREI
jgi:hypothetical protein